MKFIDWATIGLICFAIILTVRAIAEHEAVLQTCDGKVHAVMSHDDHIQLYWACVDGKLVYLTGEK